MNIIRQKQTRVAMYITEADVYEDQGVFAAEGAKLGLAIDDHEVVVGQAPEQMFFPQCMTYDAEIWTISDQAWYDSCWTGYCNAYNEKQKLRRAVAYNTKTDPIFFMYQRGEATQAQWLQAVAQVQAEFPYIGQPPQAPATEPVVQGAQTL